MTMRRQESLAARLLLALGLIACLAPETRSAVPEYRVEVVATYEVTTTLRGASDAGHFVGDQTLVGFLQPFVATLQDGLRTLPLPAGYVSGSALDVNSNGLVVGMVADNGFPFDQGEPAVWTPQPDGEYTVDVLATPATVFAAGQPRATDGGQAVAVNDAGTIVGWTRIQGFQGGPTTEFSLSGPPVDLGTAGFTATVRDLNESDVIVGGGLRMDLATGQVTELGLPDPIGTVGFTDVIAFAVNDLGETIVAANLASVVTENYLTYLHDDGTGFVQLNPEQLPSRFVGFYDNNDRGDVSASGGVLFRAENVLVGGFDGLLEPGSSQWDVALGFIDDQRRVYTTGFDSSTGTNAIVSLTPVEAATSAPASRTLTLRAAPNPFNPRTRIELRGVRPGARGSVEVFDVAGRRVRVLHDGVFGAAEFVWNGRDASNATVASGVYLVRARVDGIVSSLRVTLVE